jgi:hypothetical protein
VKPINAPPQKYSTLPKFGIAARKMGFASAPPTLAEKISMGAWREVVSAVTERCRLQLGQADRDRVLAISAATIDRLLVDVKIAANGGTLRRGSSRLRV